MSDQEQGADIERLTQGLLRWAGSASLIIDHMARNARHAFGPMSSSEAFEHMLRSALADLPKRHDRAALSAAAKVVDDAVETMAGEILLVDLACLPEDYR